MPRTRADRPGRTVSGHVVDGEGKGVAGVSVAAYPPGVPPGRIGFVYPRPRRASRARPAHSRSNTPRRIDRARGHARHATSCDRGRSPTPPGRCVFAHASRATSGGRSERVAGVRGSRSGPSRSIPRGQAPDRRHGFDGGMRMGPVIPGAPGRDGDGEPAGRAGGARFARHPPGTHPRRGDGHRVRGSGRARVGELDAPVGRRRVDARGTVLRGQPAVGAPSVDSSVAVMANGDDPNARRPPIRPSRWPARPSLPRPGV